MSAPAAGRLVNYIRGVDRAMFSPISRSLRLFRKVVRKLTLYNARHNAAAYWPDVRGLDLFLLAAALGVTRYQLQIVDWLGRVAPRWRRWSGRRAVKGHKILHVTCSFDLGGTQTQIRNLCLAPNPRWQHDVVEIFPESNYLHRSDAKIDPRRYTGRGPVGRTFGRLITNINTRSAQLFQIYKLICDLRASDPDIVVGWGHELCLLTFIAATYCRTPHIVFCVRTFNPEFGWMYPPMDRIATTSHRAMLPQVSRVVVNSTALQHDYATWVGTDPAQVAVCANGIDIAGLPVDEAERLRANVRARHQISPETIVIVHVGRFSGEKGQLSLVKANLHLRERLPGRDFCFILCGDGLTMPSVQEFAATHGMSNVIFAGRTTEVRAYLAAGDIFVMPSDFEGMPNAMMEAMAEGLPCISSDRSGALDVARNREEALYYPPRDDQALARHLETLIRDPHERRRLGRRAQARMKEFTVARFIDHFERLMDDVAGEAPPARAMATVAAAAAPSVAASTPPELTLPAAVVEAEVPERPRIADGYEPLDYSRERRIEFLEHKISFLLDEVSELRSLMRHLVSDKLDKLQIIARTAESFDYQWRELPAGRATILDEEWKKTVGEQLCQFTDLPADWFPGKTVLDAGCGGGRWTYGFGTLGVARCVSIDRADGALRSATAVAQPFGDRIQVMRKSVVEDLGWPEAFDLVWCFGVLHHTGRTYEGFQNVARCVKPGGYLFVMLYGEPRPGYIDDFTYYHEMATLRASLRGKPFDERVRELTEIYGPELVHGYFDAVSPEINDLYRWDEVLQWYTAAGFTDVHRTNEGTNHYVVGRKRVRG